MAKKKKEPETTTIEWCEPNLVASDALLRKENERLREEIDKLIGISMRQQECIKLLVSYLDAPVKARSKLADIERLLE